MLAEYRCTGPDSQNSTVQDLVQRFETCVLRWTRQVKAVTGHRERSGREGGPLEELHFWQARAADLHSISMQLDAPGLFLGPTDDRPEIQQSGDFVERGVACIEVLRHWRGNCTYFRA